jgi:hypothetical protein
VNGSLSDGTLLNILLICMKMQGRQINKCRINFTYTVYYIEYRSKIDMEKTGKLMFFPTEIELKTKLQYFISQKNI